MTLIQKLKKRISLSIAFIVFCLFTLTAGQFLPLEIKLNGLRFILYFIIFIGLPIVAIKELRRWFAKLKNKILIIGLRVLFVCLFGIYIMYALLFSFGNTMCGEITDEILFTHKGTSSNKIIVRHFDCGATDSGPAKYKIVKVVDVFSVFNFVTKIDTTKIDKTVWVRKTESD